MENIRRRYDGKRRNPWDEAECGHHYARAMASWTGVLALSGFRYHGGEQRAELFPRWPLPRFRSFWSAGTAWGMCELSARRCAVAVTEGGLTLAELAFAGSGAGAVRVTVAGRPVAHQVERAPGRVMVRFPAPLVVAAESALVVAVEAAGPAAG